jgi:hypothetical protein
MTCEAVDARKSLISDLLGVMSTARKDLEGTEEELFEVWDELTGIVAEYTDGGDEMTEACTCGKHHDNRFPQTGPTFAAKWEYYLNRRNVRLGLVKAPDGKLYPARR